MTPQEQELILTVAKRLREAPLTHKDAQAEQVIQREIGAQKDAPYLLTQAVILQEHALKQAQERMNTLETELEQARQQTSAQSRGGFLGGLFGGGSAPATPPNPGLSQNRNSLSGQTSGFGDFMRGAAGVAVGVAGGQLLFSGLSGLFGDEPTPGTEAAADTAVEPSPDAAQLAQNDPTHDNPEPAGVEEENAFDSFDMGDEEL